ncbi:MAG TPA: hypothetical protein GXX72_02105 [Clostridiaceae bacterium]|nr:hypothetical protein [Clostridiaceae bacterium]
MKSLITNIRLQFNELHQPELVLVLSLSPQQAQEGVGKLKEILSKGKCLQAEIKQHRKRRSLDANSYAWVLMSKIADALNTSKDEIYIEMLKRYGQREPQLLSVIAEGVPAIMRATNNHCTEVGQSELNGKIFVHLAILIGSSQYDSKQMATLIDGIVSECKELGIETMTPQELEGLKQTWGKSTNK